MEFNGDVVECCGLKLDVMENHIQITSYQSMISDSPAKFYADVMKFKGI